jgi:hypothetical protein
MQSGTWTGSGIIPANVDCFFIDEEFEAYNTHTGDSSTGTGSDTLSLTFTAIPEPSSLCLIGAASVGLLARRRQRDQHRHLAQPAKPDADCDECL